MNRAEVDDGSRHTIIRQSIGEVPVQDLAPRWDWGTLCESEHVAQIYETDEFLVQNPE